VTVSWSRAFVVLARKELRALAPVWAVAFVATVADGIYPARVLQDIAQLGFSFGSIALGAWSFGHEFQYESLGPTLSLPVPRFVLALAKLIPLALFLGALGIAGWLGRIPVVPWSGLGSEFFPHYDRARPYLLQFLWSLSVAPLFGIRTRAAVYGGLAAFALPFVLRFGGEFAGGLYYGLDHTHVVERFRLGIWTLRWGGFILPVLAAGLTWHAIQHLEWTAPTTFSWVTRSRRARGSQGPTEEGVCTHSHAPLRTLFAKECRIQRPTVIVTAVYLAIRVVCFFVPSGLPGVGSDVSVLDMLNLLFVSLFAGALAFSGEPGGGATLSESVLPVSTRTRWFMKAGVSACAALLLGAGAPMLLHFMHSSVDDIVSRWLVVSASGSRNEFGVLFFVSLLAWAISGHIASLGHSALRAVVAAVASIAVGFVTVHWIALLVNSTLGVVLRRFVTAHVARGFGEAVDRATLSYVSYNGISFVLLFSVFLLCSAASLAFTYRNFRTLTVPTAWRQMAALAATLGGGWTLAYVAIWSFIFTIARGWVR
jgi:hypothetical protein